MPLILPLKAAAKTVLTLQDKTSAYIVGKVNDPAAKVLPCADKLCLTFRAKLRWLP
jgi:hypothetical protein